jgi:hypothetical protein
MPNKKISQLSQISPVPTGGLMILANSGVSRSATIKEIAEAIQGSSSNTFSGLNDTPSGISGNMFAVGSPDGSGIVFSKDLHLGTGHFLDKRYGGTISGTVTMATGQKLQFASNSNFINSAGENLAIFSSSHIKMRSASGTNIYQVGGEEAKVNFYTGYSDQDKIHVIHTSSGKYISSGLNHYLNSDTDISGKIFQSGKEILTGLYQLKSDQRNFTDLADVPSNSLSSVPSHIIRVSEIGDSLEYYDTGHFVGADETGILVGRNETGQFMGTGLSGLFAEASKTGIFVVGSGVPENISAKWTKSYLSSVASSRWTQHPGGAWVANNSYSSLSQTSTSGGGSGALFNVGVDNNGTPTFTWVSGGGGYAAGDTLTFADPNNASATVVLSVDSLEALDINVLTSGITIDDGDDFYPNKTRSVSLGKSANRWKDIQTQRLEAWATGSNADGDDSWIKAKSMYTGNAYAEFIAANTESDGVMRLGISSTGVGSRNIGSGNYYLYGEGGSGSSFIIGNKHDLLFFANTGIENSHAESIAGGQNPPALKIHTSGLVTFSEAFTMPTGDGAASTFLQTDGAGTVSWGNASQNFTELSDTPSNYTSVENHIVKVNAAGNALEYFNTGHFVGADETGNLVDRDMTGILARLFSDLDDTPGSLGSAGESVVVAVGGNSLTFSGVAGGGGGGGGSSTFVGLSDTESTMGGHLGKVVYVKDVAGVNTLGFFDTGHFVGADEISSFITQLSFEQLSDVTLGANDADKFVSINNGFNGLTFRDIDFTDLGDTPTNYSSASNNFVTVNADGDGLSFFPSGSVTFASETGDFVDIYMTGNLVDIDMTGNLVDIDMTGNLVDVDMTGNLVDIDMTGILVGKNESGQFVGDHETGVFLTEQSLSGTYSTQFEIQAAQSTVASAGWTVEPGGGTWAGNQNYSNLAQTSTSGGGSGALFNVSVDNSGTPTFTWVSGGTGYVVGDTITFADPGNGPSATDIVLTINSLSGGTIYFLSEITAGSHTTTSMVPKPVINLNRGNTYKFRSTNSASSHGFYIATQAGGGPSVPHEYTSGVTNSKFGGAGKNIYFRVPQNAPEKLYYESVGATNMGNTITVWDDTGDFVLKSETGDFVDIHMTGNKLVGIESTGDFYSRRGGPISGDVSILGNSGLYVSGDLKVQSGISYNPSYYTGDDTVINWASGNLLYKNLSNVTNYNFTNVTEGQTLTMYVSNTTTSDHTPQFISGAPENAVRWPADTEGNNGPPKVASKKTNVYTFININTGIFTSYLTGYDYLWTPPS